MSNENVKVVENEIASKALEVEVDSNESLLASVAAKLLDSGGSLVCNFEDLNAMEGRVVRMTNVGNSMNIQLLPRE